jgi:hypothetical protein
MREADREGEGELSMGTRRAATRMALVALAAAAGGLIGYVVYLVVAAP